MSRQEPPTLIVGLGKTGLSIARHLRARGVAIAVTDSRKAPPALEEMRKQLPNVRVFTGGFGESQFSRAQRLVVSPGVDLGHPLIQSAMARGIEVIGDIELFARARRRPVVAITGTNGKSTVTSLVGAMARRAKRRVALGGNLGTPALNLLEIPAAQVPSYYVLELSSFQLELTHSLNAEVAVLLNVSPDHLDRHQTLEEYRRIKARVFQGPGVAVFNPLEPAMRDIKVSHRQAHHFVTLAPKPGDFGIRRVEGKDWLAHGGQSLMPATELRLPGQHNVANALAALAIGDAIGLELQPMLDTLRSFSGLPHRTQLVATFAGIDWYNDSKGTNVGATVAAAAGFSGPLVLILGGEGKGQNFLPLAKALPGKVRRVILMGKDAWTISYALKGAMPTVVVKDMAEAVLEARNLAQRGDTVLLSPACASQDSYRDYQQRGEDFSDKVMALKNRHEEVDQWQA